MNWNLSSGILISWSWESQSSRKVHRFRFENKNNFSRCVRISEKENDVTIVSKCDFFICCIINFEVHASLTNFTKFNFELNLVWNFLDFIFILIKYYRFSPVHCVTFIHRTEFLTVISKVYFFRFRWNRASCVWDEGTFSCTNIFYMDQPGVNHISFLYFSWWHFCFLSLFNV